MSSRRTRIVDRDIEPFAATFQRLAQVSCERPWRVGGGLTPVFSRTGGVGAALPSKYDAVVEPPAKQDHRSIARYHVA
jgi:hypothetical protein